MKRTMHLKRAYPLFNNRGILLVRIYDQESNYKEISFFHLKQCSRLYSTYKIDRPCYYIKF